MASAIPCIGIMVSGHTEAALIAIAYILGFGLLLALRAYYVFSKHRQEAVALQRAAFVRTATAALREDPLASYAIGRLAHDPEASLSEPARPTPGANPDRLVSATRHYLRLMEDVAVSLRDGRVPVKHSVAALWRQLSLLFDAKGVGGAERARAIRALARHEACAELLVLAEGAGLVDKNDDSDAASPTLFTRWVQSDPPGEVEGA